MSHRLSNEERSLVTLFSTAHAHAKMFSSFRPSGFMEFDITRAMRNWKAGDPNYGLLLLATNEDTVGRDIRFSSNADRTTSRHAYVNVLCDCK